MFFHHSIVKYPWACDACGATGYEYGVIEFDGHEISTLPGEVGNSE